MGEVVTQLIAPALTGFFSGFGAVIALRVEVRWIKASLSELKEQVIRLEEKVK